MPSTFTRRKGHISSLLNICAINIDLFIDASENLYLLNGLFSLNPLSSLTTASIIGELLFPGCWNLLPIDVTV